MKCGTCQKNRIANSVHPIGSTSPRTAAQPISGGNAPGIAPMIVFHSDLRLSGV